MGTVTEAASESSATGDPIPISLVIHTIYCPRRAWLESVGEKTRGLAKLFLWCCDQACCF